MLDPQRQLQLINLLLVGELGEHSGAATILKRKRLRRSNKARLNTRMEGGSHTCRERKSLLRTPKAISVLAAVLHTIGYNGSVT